LKIKNRKRKRLGTRKRRNDKHHVRRATRLEQQAALSFVICLFHSGRLHGVLQGRAVLGLWMLRNAMNKLWLLKALALDFPWNLLTD
jgi:hypothetical protein